MEYWCINDDFKPQWVQDLIDRGLLIHKPTYITDCYAFKETLETSSPIYLYDGDGLCFEDNTVGVVYRLYYHSFDELKENIDVIKYYCDMCGEEIFDVNNIYGIKLSQRTNAYTSSLKKGDLCEQCYNKISNMLKRRVKD